MVLENLFQKGWKTFMNNIKGGREPLGERGGGQSERNCLPLVTDWQLWWSPMTASTMYILNQSVDNIRLNTSESRIDKAHFSSCINLLVFKAELFHTEPTKYLHCLYISASSQPLTCPWESSLQKWLTHSTLN